MRTLSEEKQHPNETGEAVIGRDIFRHNQEGACRATGSPYFLFLLPSGSLSTF